MPDFSAEFRRCMEELDVVGVRRLWAHVQPGLPQPKDDMQALTTLHMARTAADSIDDVARVYSHAWLRDRNLPSQLPDALKQSAERLYPRVVSAVGISVNFTDPMLKPAGEMIAGAMRGAVMEAAADGRLNDDAFVKKRMAEARDRERKALFGRFGAST